jgi:hypothetical protein
MGDNKRSKLEGSWSDSYFIAYDSEALWGRPVIWETAENQQSCPLSGLVSLFSSFIPSSLANS